jgi:hypothetical protein
LRLFSAHPVDGPAPGDRDSERGCRRPASVVGGCGFPQLDEDFLQHFFRHCRIAKHSANYSENLWRQSVVQLAKSGLVTSSDTFKQHACID